ncbi:hypothetical protein EC957_008818 [Mortierella hygrophila]|uniref:C2H2-type domain-containing protein n=1 Tax=Mortierella hygrophila TaxID=979708 RepID=A0A9P6FBT9_9FUNG|nr:hypothetical protein EC957_008818 [Mortierella hygrophila]
MPPQSGESRRTTGPASGLSSSYPASSSELRPREHTVEPRSQGYTHNNSQYPPTPVPYHAQPQYSNQPGSRSSWAGYSSSSREEQGSSFSLTSTTAAGTTAGAPYFRRSVHHDPQDDYHHSPQHGTYIPPPSSSSSAIGHQEYRTNNSSSNSLDELHHPYSSSNSNNYHQKGEGSFSDNHYQNCSGQDGYSADPYNDRERGEGYESGGAAAAANNGGEGGESAGDSGGKHRNNSVSSNASQSSSSSLSHYHPHMSGNKHPCKFPTCGWSFKRYEHLKRHMLVHTKERAFVCDYHGCEKSFSRSDNFSAHLRTHSKKSAAVAAAAAAGTTAAHIRRFERQQQQMTEAAATGGSGSGDRSMMIDPIRTNFPNSSTSALVSSGPSERRGVSGDGEADHAHHRHSIAGYPSYSGGSRSPLQMQNIYSHGLPTPVTNHGPNSATTKSVRNSYCGPSSATSDDPAPSEYDQQKQQPKSATSSSSVFSFRLPSEQQQQQQYHKRSSSFGMHPLDSPTTPTTTTSPTSLTPGATGTVDGIVPKFNTIKLDLKSVTNHPEDSPSSQRQYQNYHHHKQYQQQQQRRRFSSPEAKDDIELKRSGSVRLGSSSPYPYHHHQRHQQQHRYSSGSIHSGGFKSEEHDEDRLLSQRRESSPGLGREHEHDDERHYEESASSDTVTGYERPNPNPNGESPVLVPRGAHHPAGNDEMETVKYEQQASSAVDFPASISSHFTPVHSSGDNKPSSSRPGSPSVGDLQEGALKSSNGDERGLSSSSSNSSLVSADRRPSSSSAVHMSGSYQHLNGSVSPPRSNSESYSGSVAMDEDGNPLHPQHRHHPGYHHPQHHGGGFGDYDRAGGNPPSPRPHYGPSSSSLYYPPQHYGGPFSSSSMNGGGYSSHHHHQYSSYHSQQQPPYPMEESGSYHHGHPGHPSHHGHHNMPPIPPSSLSSHAQQQQQSLPPPLQAPQRAGTSGSGVGSGIGSSTMGGGGGRVRGMTSSAKNHCCPVSGCMKRFKRLEHLKRHTKTHTLERPFACLTAGCNKRFSRSDNLSQHIKTHQRQLMSKIHWKQRSM